jgi:hypothetical protein
MTGGVGDAWCGWIGHEGRVITVTCPIQHRLVRLQANLLNVVGRWLLVSVLLVDPQLDRYRLPPRRRWALNLRCLRRLRTDRRPFEHRYSGDEVHSSDRSGKRLD